jgi:hypothetical protein
MVSFKFSFGVVGKSKEKGIVNKYVIIVAKCEGIIRYIDGTYKVEYNGKLYSITGESYRTTSFFSIINKTSQLLIIHLKCIAIIMVNNK